MIQLFLISLKVLVCLCILDIDIMVSLVVISFFIGYCIVFCWSFWFCVFLRRMSLKLWYNIFSSFLVQVGAVKCICIRYIGDCMNFGTDIKEISI